MSEEFQILNPLTEKPAVIVTIEDEVPDEKKEEIRAQAFNLANLALEAAGVETLDGLSGMTVEKTLARAPRRSSDQESRGLIPGIHS